MARFPYFGRRGDGTAIEQLDLRSEGVVLAEDAAVRMLPAVRRAVESDTPLREVDFAATPSPGSFSGVDGDSWYWNAVAGGPDINPDLMGRRKYEVFWEMKITDPAIRSLLYMWKLPLRSATWKNEAASEDGIDELIKDAACWQFGLNDQESRLDLSWDEQLQQWLHVLDYGAEGEELVWADVETWTDDEGGEHMLRPLSRLAPRAVATVFDIETDKQTGALVRARQDLPGADWMEGIRRDPSGKPGTVGKLAWFALEREQGSWWGQSQIRSAYGPWLMKKGLMVASGVGWDRYAAGIPVVRHPKNATAAEKQKAEEMGRNVRTHERAWIVLEGAPDEGWDFGIESGAQSLMDPVPLLRYYDQQIAANGLQQFSSLGTTETGSRAVGEVLSDPYYLALQALAKAHIEHRKRVVWRRWVDVNFGPQYKVPNLSVSKIQGRNVAVLARALADLSSAGFAFTDRDTQNDVRDIIDLRHLPEEAAAAIQELPDETGLRPITPAAAAAIVQRNGRVPVEGGSVSVVG